MKKTLVTIICIFVVCGLYAQAPHKFNYQAVLRDTQGNIIANNGVLVGISILQGGPTGALVFGETHAATTNDFGLVNLQIGSGTITHGSIDTIDWAAGPYFIQISVNGNTFGNSQLLSVPYALYAENSGTPGLQGPQGNTGPTGASGQQGLQGTQGSTGQQGLAGLTGATGLTGPAGPTGATGQQGLQGIQGPYGTTGATGSQGLQGIQGNTGAQGLQGTQGSTGQQGLQGIQGPYGTTGATGSQGLQGIQGTTGAQGLQGTQGSTGQQGLSGLTGATGLTGPAGPTGATGQQGVQGIQGPYGTTGATGPQGLQGIQGPCGPTGATGPLGLQGIQGSTGAQGLQGTQGPTGAQGLQGTQGSTGQQGLQGIQGPYGPTGTTGQQGLQGIQGTTGPTGPLMPGTQGQTLHHDGNSWVANSNLYNSGTNIGIGTTMPASKLDVAGNGVFTGTVSGADAIDSNEYITKGQLESSIDTSIWVKSANNIYNTNSGNVGIGTGAPSARLEVQGDSLNKSGSDDCVPLFQVNDNQGNPVFVVYPKGVMVYIDTTTCSSSKTNETTEVSGFRVGKKTGTGSKGFENEYFTISADSVADTITSQPRILWYPLKEAFMSGRVIVESPDSVGLNSWASGFESKSIGNYSQALGYKPRALGNYSTAIGNYALAYGDNSFALGDSAVAGGGGGIKAANNNCYAFGKGTEATGSGSYAFGYKANSTGNDAFAIGAFSEATGIGSYAFGAIGRDTLGILTGVTTKAEGDYSFAFGLGSQSVQKGAFAMGTMDTASGSFSTAMGYGTKAYGYFATTMGYGTKAATYCTAMGSKTTASGTGSTAMGFNTVAIGMASTAMGYGSKAIGWYSTALGFQTIDSGLVSTAMGGMTKAIGDYSTAMGYSTRAGGYSSTAMGYLTKANGDYSIATGRQTTASGHYSTAMGYLTTASGTYSTAMGQSTTAGLGWSTAMGNSTTASNYYSTAMGFNTTASEQAATAMGYFTTASGMNSTAMGINTTAQSYASTVLGRFNVISGATNSWIDTDPLFVIGKGSTSGARSNAMTVLKNGYTGIGTSSPFCGLDVEIAANSATFAKFGDALPLYIIANNPSLGFNAYWSGTAWKFGKGSSNKYAAIINLDPTTGTMTFNTTSSGNADDACTTSNRLTILQNGDIGIGTATPSNDLSFGSVNWGNSRIIAIERSTSILTLNANGSPFHIIAGGATSGQANKSGGGLYLSGGVSTGTGTSNIYFQTTTAGSNGTADNNPTTKMTLYGDSRLLMYSGAECTAGGVWTNASDVNLKENFTQINGADLLAKIETLPITRWNYKTEDKTVMHIGPMAQDFNALFNIGNNLTSISTIDPAGISLVAIKELIKINKTQQEEIDRLKSEIENIKLLLKVDK